ncbi:acyl-CoA dehydrogenase family protein [Xanthobacter autotrophicus]|jgi:alkylation response protein AidB-like acyl-CoA dehydrogenase|uniref:acyl-CoA dehydrogenase family protein n=1 Tax=Xanthobacter autotrophicus TaxID=280 RepID=UPI0024A65702|nr:acyl-CoA dehydrogenase family protein [Xanthobacter autotrophicus]MDI4656445.1 acyl-CoA dehydrogenase family protein [Xanthobacter autotrophicus]
MSQIDDAWGAGPTPRYEDLAQAFRPIFRRIRDSAVEREIAHRLPREEISWLKDAGFTTLRLPQDEGGFGATLPELFNLLIELAEADPNVTNALRAHFGFTEEVLNSPFKDYRDRWVKRIAAGETSGSGFSEAGDNKVGHFSTRVVRHGDTWHIDGEKYYTTGSLFADWINLGADDENGDFILAQVPTSAPGVTIEDDWDGFGQQLTASGTAKFSGVTISNDLVNPLRKRFRYSVAFYQLVHLATLAGIGRAAAGDVARLVNARKRVFSHGNADRVGADPQILQVVGKVRANAYGAGATVLRAAEALQRVYDTRGTDVAETQDLSVAVADLEVNQGVTVVTTLVLEATTLLFDALGASAAKRGVGLDRHWRNARTLSSHNPRIYRERIVGDFAVNGTWPPGPYRVGQP